MYQYQPFNSYPMASIQPNMAMNKQQIIKVNGEAGADAFQLPPNSSALLLDENEPRLFLAQTDGAGYKSVTAYKLVPYEAKKPINLQDITERLNRLEEIINEQSNIRDDSQPERNQPNVKKSKQSIQRVDAE